MENESVAGEREFVGIAGIGPGTVLADRYEIVGLLGQGGMGAVYEATHRVIKKRVAVKLLRAEVASSPAVVQRFLQEARAANEVRHKNIVEVIDFGVDRGMPFLVMEYLDGEPLTKWLARSAPAPVGPLLAMLLPVGRALDYAHTKGFVHRDVKPDNVFIAKLPGERASVPKVLDFGIAKSTLDPDVRLTSTNASMGTPLYMAPEQVGGAKNVTQAADQYAFAAVIYEALAGRPPYVAETYNELIVAKVTAEAEPLLAHRPDVSEALARVVQRALSRDPKARFESMEAFCAALEPFVDEASSGDDRAPKRAAPHPDALAATADASLLSAPAIVSERVIEPSLAATAAPSESAPEGERARSEAPRAAIASAARADAASRAKPSAALVATGIALLAAVSVAFAVRSKREPRAERTAVDQRTSRGPSRDSPPPAMAMLVFAYAPPEAEIVLDGRVIGRGTTQVQLPVDAVAHSLRVRATGYLDDPEQRFTVAGPRAFSGQLSRDPALFAAEARDASSSASVGRASHGNGASGGNQRVHNNNGRLQVRGDNPILSRPH